MTTDGSLSISNDVLVAVIVIIRVLPQVMIICLLVVGAARIEAGAVTPGELITVAYLIYLERMLQAGAGEAMDGLAGADGYLLGTPANFGYMSGALKHFFDTIFLEAGGALGDDGSAAAGEGGKKPYGLFVHGRYDTTGAVRSVQSIVGALPWRQAAPVLEVLGEVGEDQREAAYELGGTLAALVMA